MNTELKSMTDLELARVQGQLYQEFIRLQGNLLSINKELQERVSKLSQDKERV